MTPSLEGLPTKAEEAPSPHEVRLVLLDTNPVFQSLGGKLIYAKLIMVFTLGDYLIYAKLIMVFTPNFGFSPYSEVIHEHTTFKLKQRLKKNNNYSIWCFWSFIHFSYCNVPDNKCYKQKSEVLFFTCIKLVAHKWKKLVTSKILVFKILRIYHL